MQQLTSMLASLTGIGAAAESAAAPTIRLPSDQHDSPLFGIPIDLRDIIYTHVLTYRRRLLDPTHAECEEETSTALLRTCRRVHNEARLHVHFNDTYIFSTPETTKAFLSNTSTRLLRLNIAANETQSWTGCESWFDDWRGFLVPVPGHARDHDSNFDVNIAIPRIDTLTIDLSILSRTIHAQTLIEHQLGHIAIGSNAFDPESYNRWVYNAGTMNSGLLYILYAIIHALNGVLPPPAWLHASTRIRIIGLSAVDASSVVEVEFLANVEACNRFIGLARDRNGFCPPARLTGPGRYLLTLVEEADPADAAVKTVHADLRRDSLSLTVGTSGTT